MSVLPKNLRDMAYESGAGSPDADVLIRAAQFIEFLQGELGLSQGEVGSLGLWVMQLKGCIRDLENYIDRLQKGTKGHHMGIRTYDLGESLRKVPSPSLPMFGNYTILCSEVFGVRMADGGSRQDVPDPESSGEGFRSPEWQAVFAQAKEQIEAWPAWKKRWIKDYLSQPLDDGSWMDERGNGAW